MFYIYGICLGEFHALNYCIGGLAYTTRRLRITSLIVTIARYVDTTIMQGTRSIVKTNIIFDSMMYTAINGSEKSIFETDKLLLQ